MTKKQRVLAKKIFVIGTIFLMVGASVAGAVLSLISY